MSGISVKNESCIMGCQQAGGQMSGIAVKNELCNGMSTGWWVDEWHCSEE